VPAPCGLDEVRDSKADTALQTVKAVKDRNIYDMDVEELMPALRKGMESAKKWYEEHRISVTFVQWRYQLRSKLSKPFSSGLR
jgi:uncharacterized membrane-anchored protein